jgi:hypothetical protein
MVPEKKVFVIIIMHLLNIHMNEGAKIKGK